MEHSLQPITVGYNVTKKTDMLSLEKHLNQGFSEISQDELDVLNGGAILELTVGAKIAIAFGEVVGETAKGIYNTFK